jgi:hypothetical protein
MRRAWVAILLLLAAEPATAALLAATSVEEAARSSDAVVRGTVLSARGRLAAGGRRVVTDVEIAVASAWKGAPGETVHLVIPGGTTASLGMAVDGAPRFEEGEDVVVFLGRNGAFWQVMGLAMGKYRVVGPEALPAFASEDVLPRALAAGERAAGPMPVAELERRVRSAR